ncbi:MAG: glycerophosphodiester phosphodiesterase [Vampirovibrionales bacterium]|nr:glycerophosphodiester phosphodiesterase [Vampirovibrionales bacterium]
MASVGYNKQASSLAHPSLNPVFGLEKIGHRGTQIIKAPNGYDVFVENTIPAFEKSARLGLDAVELDVILTKDGQLAVHHDDRTGRVFRLQKPSLITETPWNHVKKATYNLGEFFNSTVLKKLPLTANAHLAGSLNDLRIPTLEEVVERTQAINPNMHFYIEIKALNDGHMPEHFPAAGIPKLVAFIQKNKLHNNVTVISFNPFALEQIKALDANINTGLNYTGTEPLRFKGEGANHSGKLPPFIPKRLMNYLKDIQINSFIPPFAEVTKRMVDQCHRAGLNIVPWVWHETRDQEAAEIERLKTLGVDGIISNNPDLLLK